MFLHTMTHTIKGNSPGEAGVPPTIKGSPLNAHVAYFMLMGSDCGVSAIACTSASVDLLYSLHSKKK